MRPRPPPRLLPPALGRDRKGWSSLGTMGGTTTAGGARPVAAAAPWSSPPTAGAAPWAPALPAPLAEAACGLLPVSLALLRLRASALNMVPCCCGDRTGGPLRRRREPELAVRDIWRGLVAERVLCTLATSGWGPVGSRADAGFGFAFRLAVASGGLQLPRSRWAPCSGEGPYRSPGLCSWSPWTSSIAGGWRVGGGGRQAASVRQKRGFATTKPGGRAHPHARAMRASCSRRERCGRASSERCATVRGVRPQVQPGRGGGRSQARAAAPVFA